MIDINDLFYDLGDKIFYGKNDFNNIRINKNAGINEGDIINLSLIRVSNSKKVADLLYKVKKNNLICIHKIEKEDCRVTVFDELYRFAADNEKFEGRTESFLIKPRDYKTNLILNCFIASIVGLLIYFGFSNLILKEFLENQGFVNQISTLFDEVLVANISLLIALLIQMFEPYSMKEKAIDLADDEQNKMLSFLLIYLFPLIIIGLSIFGFVKGFVSIITVGVYLILGLEILLLIILLLNRFIWKSFKTLDLLNDINHKPLNLYTLIFLAVFISFYTVFNYKGNIKKLDDFNNINTYLAIYEIIPKETLENSFRLNISGQVLKTSTDKFLLNEQYEQGKNYLKIIIRFTGEEYKINKKYLTKNLIRKLKSRSYSNGG